MAVDHDAVDGQDLTGAQVKHHAAAHVLGPHLDVLAVNHGPHALAAHDHAVAKRQVGARLHVLFHEGREGQQEADRARLAKLAAQARDRDGGGVQDLNGHFSAQKMAQALDHVTHGVQARDGHAHRHGQQHALDDAPGNEVTHLYLEAVVLEAHLKGALARAQAHLGHRQRQRVQGAYGGENRVAGGGVKGYEYGAHRRMDLGGANTVEAHELVRDAAGLFV